MQHIYKDQFLRLLYTYFSPTWIQEMLAHLKRWCYDYKKLYAIEVLNQIWDKRIFSGVCFHVLFEHSQWPFLDTKWFLQSYWFILNTIQCLQRYWFILKTIQFLQRYWFILKTIKFLQRYWFILNNSKMRWMDTCVVEALRKFQTFLASELKTVDKKRIQKICFNAVDISTWLYEYWVDFIKMHSLNFVMVSPK